MTTAATIQKRRELIKFIEIELAPEPAVQAVIGIGSLANGLARPDSDIDAIVFLDPFDLYATPAEFIWCPADRSFHSIFSDAPGVAQGIQFDLQRLDFRQWSNPSFVWPEGRCAELQAGWLAFDRNGKAAELIAARTVYTDAVRTARLDEALVWLDEHLGGDGPHVRWDSLGSLIAHDRLNAAYEYLVQALFAYNRRWRPWRNREMSSLAALPWLPVDFASRVPEVWSAASADFGVYMTRVEVLRGLVKDLSDQLVGDGLYGDDIIGEAFIRSHEEPGRAWNIDEWIKKHSERRKTSG